MEIQLTSFQHPNVERRYSTEWEVIYNASNEQNIPVSKKTRRKSHTAIDISKPRGLFYQCIESRKLRVCGSILFIILSITAGVLVVCLTSSDSSKSCERDFQRTMKSSLVSSSQPQSLALADLDNDHKMDIIVANSGNDTIGIFFGMGNEFFLPQDKYPTGFGSYPSSITINDFNNDNYSDIAVANYGTNNIGIFLNNGNTIMKDQKVFQLDSSRPLFIASGDFNKDNYMDLAVVNSGTNNIGILLGYGDGTFKNQTTYSTGYDSFPSSLVLADFNTDNYLDIAVTNSGTNNIGIFMGYGNGTFANQQIYTTFPKSNPLSIAVGDFDNDYKLDLVVANNGSGKVGIFFGYRNGSFQAQKEYPLYVRSRPQYVTVGNVNTDNILDIVVVDSENDEVHVLPGNETGNFPLITTYEGTYGSRPSCVAVTNLDGNDQSDIVVTNYGTSNVVVLLDYSVKLSAKQTNYDVRSSSGSNCIATGDFDNDHIFDLVYATSSYIRLRFGLNGGTFDTEIQYLTNMNGTQHICVGDLNNDSNMDIVAAFINSNSIGILLGNGNRTFRSLNINPTGAGSRPNWVALGDINNDHRLDIVSVNTGSNSIGIHLGNGDGTFGVKIPYSTDIGTEPMSVAIDDLNYDTYLDLVVVTDNGYIVILRGEGGGNFTIWNSFSTLQGFTLSSVTLGYFNSDTYLDVAVTNTYNDSIDVFFGNGDATFGTQISYPTGADSNPYYVITADFNNDNISDLAITNYGTSEVIMFYGLDNGNFQHDRTYSTGVGSKPYGIATADFDGNTQLDLVVALSGNRRIAILDEYKAAVFNTEQKYRTGSAPQPYSIALGDFNNDKKSDIVVANSGDDSLTILFGSDNGKFYETVNYDLGIDSYPSHVITCDIDKDGQLDIISVSSKANSISVIMGTGSEKFSEQVKYPTGDDSNPVAVAAGDLNNDHWLDLLVANQDVDKIGFFFGFNYRTFAYQGEYSNIYSLSPTDIVVTDLDNDDFVDIIVTFYGSDRMGILLGGSYGNFDPIMTYSTSTNSGPWGITVNDFDGDGQSDIAVATYDANAVLVFLGYSNTDFTKTMRYRLRESSGPKAITTGDVNNDKQLDIIVVNTDSNNIGILIGYGNGNFSNSWIYIITEYTIGWYISVVDFDNDGNLDIATGNDNASSVEVLFGYGNGTFINPVTLRISDSSRPEWLTVGDFNKDNLLDIAVADQNNNEIHILRGYGNRTFAVMTTYPLEGGSSPSYLHVDDFNNDNISDIVVINKGTKSISVLFGMKNGGFILGKQYSTSNVTSELYALAVGDFNNDKRLDIAVADIGANNVGIFLAYSTEYFATQTTSSLEDGAQPSAVALRDINSDGCLDRIVVNQGTGNLIISYTACNGNLKPVFTYSIGADSAPSSVDFADFNNDTYLDIVVTNSESNNIIILLSTADAMLLPGKNYTTGTRSRPYTVSTGDFNNDNIIDIAVGNYGTNNILLLYGHGDGTFVNETFYVLGYNYNPASIVLKDLNHDNFLDIVIACHDTDHIETFITACSYTY